MTDASLKYKGFTGTYHYNKDMKAFVGEVQNVNGMFTFQGRTFKELKNSFHNTIDKGVLK